MKVSQKYETTLPGTKTNKIIELFQNFSINFHGKENSRFSDCCIALLTSSLDHKIKVKVEQVKMINNQSFDRTESMRMT